jgi:thiamine pyrophosphate-dependent acetolactate synthase large subunit-like protein
MAGRSEGTLDRREVVAHILKSRGTSLLVTGLGAPTWDAAAAGDNPNNFYLWGGMGGAVSVGLGLALAQPDRRVLVLTGDGEMLMGLGSLATVGIQKPKNLAVCVIDNQRYGETGMQETATFFGVDLSAIAQGAGFLNALTIRDQDDLALAIRDIFVTPGPVFVAVKVKPTDYPMVLPEKDGLELKHRFRAQILGARKEI